MNKNKTAIIIGSGFGGLSLACRLQAMGFETTVIEKLDKPGGRAYQKIVEVDGIKGQFKFDMGPTVLTVPQFIEEIFALEKGKNQFAVNFTKESLGAVNKIKNQTKNYKVPTAKPSPTFTNTNFTKKYVDIVPINPFYRIYFADGTFFDYDSSMENAIRQIKELTNEDEVEGYKKFRKQALEVFKIGFLKHGYTAFQTPWSMLRLIPEMLKLDVIRSLDSYAKKCFKHPKTQFLFSFETLLIGGNPASVPALYVMIHFVESAWRVHYAMNGTGKLVEGFVKKFTELGGQIKLNSQVEEILVTKRKACGVKLKSGEIFKANIVCSNADYAHTYENLVKGFKLQNNKLKTNYFTEYSNSLFVLYFGFKKNKNTNKDLSPNLRHHNIIRGDNLIQDEFRNIYETGKINKNFSQYLHVPTITDASMAPQGYHTAYTLVVVSNKKIGTQDWSKFSPQFANKIIKFLDEKGFIPDLKKRLVYKSWADPDYFEKILGAKFGNAFGPIPVFRQSGYFRPRLKSGDISNLYCVGASYQPGAGTPSVMMSAKMVAKLIAQDFGIISPD